MNTKLSRREFLAGTMGACAAGLLAACAVPPSAPAEPAAEAEEPGAEAEEPAAEPAAPETVTIRYVSWPGMAYEDSERAELLDPFEAENPGVKVELELIPYGDCWQKLATLAAAGDMPDFFSMCALKYADFLPKGVLLDLEPFITTLNKDDYYFSLAEILRAESDDPNLYAIPFRGVITAMAINQTAFAEAGEEWPDKDWTWDDVLEVAKRVTKKDADGNVDVYGFRVSSSHQWYDALLYSNGGEVLDDTLRECKLNSPINVETTQWLVDFIYEWGVAPNPAEVEGMENPFVTGKVAMTPFLSYLIQPWQEIEEFDWDIWWMPTGKVDMQVYGGPDSMSISRDTPLQEECLALMAFALSEKRGIASFGDGSIPFIKAATASEDWLKAGGLEHKQVLLDMMPNLGGIDFGRGWSEWRSSVMNNELAPAFLGEKSVEEAMESAHKAIQAVLDDVYA
jgi:multiple sugar transport system substrate-binding protein